MFAGDWSDAFIHLGQTFHVWEDAVAMLFAAAAITLSGLQILHHSQTNVLPKITRSVQIILFMVIIYSVEAWAGLYFPPAHVYLNSLRDTYEAITIFYFYDLMVEQIGGWNEVVDTFEMLDQTRFAKLTWWGVLQYCIVQIFCAIAIFVLESLNVYNEGTFSWTSGYPYIAIIRTFSQGIALYCLVMFYHGLVHLPEHLDVSIRFREMRPVPKFLCVKGVIFFTFWQSLLIAIFVHFGLIGAGKSWSNANLAVSLQDFVICLEMFVFSTMHLSAFRAQDFKQNEHGYIVDFAASRRESVKKRMKLNKERLTYHAYDQTFGSV